MLVKVQKDIERARIGKIVESQREKKSKRARENKRGMFL